MTAAEILQSDDGRGCDEFFEYEHEEFFDEFDFEKDMHVHSNLMGTFDGQPLFTFDEDCQHMAKPAAIDKEESSWQESCGNT